MTRLTRRDLLKRAALSAPAVALPTIVPSSAWGHDVPAYRVNLAAIGTGNRALGNATGRFLPLADVRIVAACDCFASKRERFAAAMNKHYGRNICKTYADFREVLDRSDIDGVIISTQDHWHVPLAWYAAKARKHLYVEKPLGVAMAWAWKLRDQVRSSEVVFQYGTQQRGDQPQFRQACELVRNGYIGQVKRVDAWCPDMSEQFNQASVPPYGSTEPIPVPDDLDYEMWIGPAPMRPYTADRCTRFGGFHIYDYALGFVAGWGAHPLDIAQWGLDTDHTSPVHYEGAGKLPPEGSLWDTVESWDVRCRYADGVEIRFMGHRAAEPVITRYRPDWQTHGTTFFGDEGWVSVDRRGLYASDERLKTIQLKPSDKRLGDPDHPTDTHARNFVDSMKTGRPTLSPLESAIRSDTISHLTDICIRTGRPIRWDPQPEQIVGDAEASRMLDRPIRGPWKME